MDIPAGRVRLNKSSRTGRPLRTMTLSCAQGCVHWPAVPQGEECTQVRGRQLCAAAARVGCEYHGPPHPLFGLLPPTPDSWPCSCSLRPRRRSDGSLGTATPTPPRGASSPGTGGGRGGTQGAEGDTCAFSTQLPNRSGRISQLRDQTAAGGSPLPGGLTQARTVCQQIPSTPQPCSSRGLQTARGQLCWRAVRGNQYSQHTHTHSSPLSVNTGPQMLSQPPTHRPREQIRDGLWDTHSSPRTPSLTTPDTRR